MIDVADKRLITAHKQNARISWVNLAEKVNLSASACQRRVEALQSAGVIKKFTVDLDPLAMGLTIHAFISVKVERQNVDTASAFRARITAYPEVQACYKLSGNIDYLINVAAADIKALSSFIDNKLLALEGVVDASSAIVLEDLECSGAVV